MKAFASSNLCSKILEDILILALQEIHLIELITNQHDPYSSYKSLQLSKQIYFQFYYQQQSCQSEIQESQPCPLKWDNMFPVDVSINSNEEFKQISNKYKKNYQLETNSLSLKPSRIRNSTQISSTSVTTIKKSKKSRQYEKYEKLDLPERSEQQKIYKQLRKQIEKDEQQKKTKQLEKKRMMEEAEKRKNSQGKNGPVGFTYEGAIIKLSSQNRNRLIQGGMHGLLKNKVFKTKEDKGPPLPQQIQYPRNIIKKPLVPKSQIEFTDIRTLFSDAQASKGVRLQEGGISIEDQQRIVPVKELKKNLGTYKLSKQQYKRLKESMGVVAQYQDLGKSLKSSDIQETHEKYLESQRSVSQSKISNQLTRRRSTITISDPQLLDNMLYGPVNQAQQRTRIKQEINQEESDWQLDKIDNYNLQYLKRGGNMTHKNKSKSMADLLTLPKINGNKSHFGSTKQMPRGRQKLKEGKGRFREIRKKFQDKLRL